MDFMSVKGSPYQDYTLAIQLRSCIAADQLFVKTVHKVAQKKIGLHLSDSSREPIKEPGEGICIHQQKTLQPIRSPIQHERQHCDGR